MKEKGFTLIELLAVIVILSVITLITIPMVMNVIEESKKKALASSIQGLVESANLYAIENDGVYEFLFNKEHKGSTKKGESLDYRGNIDGEGKLYLDREGNVSVCISNDTYYVYKNYNSGIIVGERSKDNCNIEYDALTNKYVAFLESEGTGSNIYSKDEVNNLVDSLDTKIINNTSEIANLKSNIEELKNNLNNYALQSELEKTNSNLNNLSSTLSQINSNISSLSLAQLYDKTFENAELLYRIGTKGTTNISIDKDEYPYLLVSVAHTFTDGWWSNSPYQLVKTSLMGYDNEFSLRGTYASIRHEVSTSWQKLTSVYIPYDSFSITIYGIKG